MNAKPLGNRVVVKPVDADTETAGGIIIPDNVAEKPNQAVVLAVGPGRRTPDGELVPMSVKVADRVLYNKPSGHTVKIDGEEVVVLVEDEIFAIVE